MTFNEWLGLILGAALGIGYGLWQRHAMGAGPRPDAVGGAFAGAGLRLVVLMVVVWLVWQFTPARRGWFVGGLMVAYGTVFVVTMWKAMRKTK